MSNNEKSTSYYDLGSLYRSSRNSLWRRTGNTKESFRIYGILLCINNYAHRKYYYYFTLLTKNSGFPEPFFTYNFFIFKPFKVLQCYFLFFTCFHVFNFISLQYFFSFTKDDNMRNSFFVCISKLFP